jgi:hypothetical protein
VPLRRRPTRLLLTAAIILSLVAGVWISLNPLLAGGGIPRNHWSAPGVRSHGLRMQWISILGARDDAASFWWPWVSLVAAALVLLGAVMIYAQPQYTAAWSASVLTGAVLNLFLGAGLLIASLLALIGGILALIVGLENRTGSGAAGPEDGRSHI